MNGSYHKYFVLDTYAVICYLEDETGAEEVALLLKKAGDNNVRLFMTWINLGEVYYRVYRKYGKIEAEKVLETVKKWPVEFLAGDEDLTMMAARVKASCALSYADAYAIAVALKKKAAVVTGDPEIKNASVKLGFPLIWLGRD
ncbi:type II toxin-antitoxin system VapC family toxin [Moorella sulfitireducens (nom. illeg.)]|uniref:type II toxin-antitoxin system VapC family toxin n=1 Tax=Neomoorella sulfitireducens TaxID=2972948 RepID=UPI0021ABC472|nr:type II toxin-antitoxin system VapC family toxin [Moorella sulfitireducens]